MVLMMMMMIMMLMMMSNRHPAVKRLAWRYDERLTMSVCWNIFMFGTLLPW